MVYFFQFRLRFAGSHNTGTCLVCQVVTPAEQAAYHDCLGTTAVKANKPDASPIITSLGRFILADQFHRPDLWRAAQGSCRKRYSKQFKRVTALPELSFYFTHQVNHM